MAMPDRATTQERDRQRKAMELHLSGWTYDDIAQELGYADHSGPVRAVQAMLKRVESPLVDELRKVEDMRLEALFRRHWPDAIGGDQKAAELVLKIHDRRVKLHGLAMPEKYVIAQVGQVDKDQAALDIMGDLAALGYSPPVTPLEVDTGGEWSNIEESPSRPPIGQFGVGTPHHRQMTTFGPPDSKSDDDVLEGISFWDAKAAQYDSDGEPDAAAQCREEAAKYRAEAIKRGIL